jgi:hypothetical protein
MTMLKLRIPTRFALGTLAAVAAFLTGCVEPLEPEPPVRSNKPVSLTVTDEQAEKNLREEMELQAKKKEQAGGGESPEAGVDEHAAVDGANPEPEYDPDNPSGLPLLPNPLLEAAIKEAEANRPNIPEVEEPKLPELGDPLVDNLKDLQRLQRGKPIWIDQKGEMLVVIARVCQQETLLEMFACLHETKEHEAIVAADIQAYIAHAGLLAIGADVGNTVRWDPVYVPASGSEIDIELRWKDEDGKTQTAKAQDWIRNTKTKKAMKYPFVFAGSGFWEDQETGKKHYQAEGGDFICVSNFPTATLDIPVRSSQGTEQLMFEAFTERIPPRGTPVTMIMTVGDGKFDIEPDEAEAAETDDEPEEAAEKSEEDAKDEKATDGDEKKEADEKEAEASEDEKEKSE